MRKFDRQGVILRLVSEQELSTQAELADALREAGFDAVQTTVSRDIAQLGLVKVRNDEGRLVYAPPGAADLSRLGELASALRRWALSIVPTGNLVVIQTPPGHANALARAIDAQALARHRRHGRGRRHDLRRRARRQRRRTSQTSCNITWKEKASERHRRARLLGRARHELRDRVAEGGLRVRGSRRRPGRRRPGSRLRRRRSRAGMPQERTTSCWSTASDAFANDQVAKALLANALYEGRYPLVSALSRPVIAEAVAEVALELGADAVVHGCTGKGNDQLRFELAFKAKYPGVQVIAPLRDKIWTRDDEIELRRGSRASRSRRRRSSRTRSTTICSAARSRRGSSKTRGSRRPRTRSC